jgi:hypothetical protein
MPAMNPFVGVSATQPREAASFNETLDSTGFCACVLPLDFSWLTVSPPVSQLRRSTTA